MREQNTKRYRIGLDELCKKFKIDAKRVKSVSIPRLQGKEKCVERELLIIMEDE